MRNLDDVFIGLANSPFRQRFKLDAGDQRYLVEKGLDLVLVHAWGVHRSASGPCPSAP